MRGSGTTNTAGVAPAVSVVLFERAVSVVLCGRETSERSGALARALTQHSKALGQDLFEVLGGAALHEHVPVGARRLHLLRLGPLAVDEQCLAAADLALPDRRHVCLGREGHRERVTDRAVVDDVLTCGHFGAAVRLVRHGAETASAKN